MNRVIGILGGMGPEATLDLYRQIIRLTPARRDQDHIRVLIYSNPKIPDRTRAIKGQGESPLPFLIESAGILEKGGAGIIAVPCNASHHYLGELRRKITTPVLDMVAETCGKLVKTGPDIKTAGLLATEGTLQSGVYHRALSAAGIDIMLPGDREQKQLNEAISEIKAGIRDASTRMRFHSIAARLIDDGAQAIILGCTEIPLALDPETVEFLCLNSTRVLAEAAVAWALGKR
ncbi:MAG TPA: amino acid racemase [Acidobacteriota bacterium]|nr:amino acid racemase [Acidobacteriota bacterium]